MRTVFFTTLGSLALVWACPAQQQTWEVRNSSVAPAAQCGHSMAYDAARRRTVLFGSGTWEWDGNTWTQMVTPVAPSPRRNSAMAYDANRGRVVLFGGYGGGWGYLADTWTWDGIEWTEVTPAKSPPARGWAALAYDQRRGRTVLFGGYPALADTWEWDGTNWVEVGGQIRPAGRWGHDMAYDASRQAVVLYGGHSGQYTADTWEWNGQSWRQIKTLNSPAACGWHKMVYDTQHQRTVMFGGLDGKVVSAATLVYQNADWTSATVSGRPPGRGDHAMVYDSTRRRVVMFGGYWRLAGTADPYGTGCGAGQALTLAAEGRPVIGETFTLFTSDMSTPGILFAGWRQEFRSLAPFGMPGCELYQSLDVAWPLPVNQGRGEFPVDVPDHSALTGLRLYFQALHGASTSNGVAVKVGNPGGLLNDTWELTG